MKILGFVNYNKPRPINQLYKTLKYTMNCGEYVVLHLSQPQGCAHFIWKYLHTCSDREYETLCVSTSMWGACVFVHVFRCVGVGISVRLFAHVCV